MPAKRYVPVFVKATDDRSGNVISKRGPLGGLYALAAFVQKLNLVDSEPKGCLIRQRADGYQLTDGVVNR